MSRSKVTTLVVNFKSFFVLFGVYDIALILLNKIQCLRNKPFTTFELIKDIQLLYFKS